MANNIADIVDKLSNEISSDVGNMNEDELYSISDSFDKVLNDALKVFNTSSFDDDGFIKRMRDLHIDGKSGDVVKNVLNTVKQDYIDLSSLNQSELLLRRDMYNICTQMPEMRDVIYVVRDSIIECNVATGEVSRSITFENHSDNAAYEAQVKEIEDKHDLLMAIKNFIVPKGLMSGEMYIHVVPYAKLFAELEMMKDLKNTSNSFGSGFRESIPNEISRSFSETKSLYSEENFKFIMESVSPITKIDSTDAIKINSSINNKNVSENIPKECVKSILERVHISKGSSVLMEEMGAEGFKDFLMKEYKNSSNIENPKSDHFTESITGNKFSNSIFGSIDQDGVDSTKYSHIKGCYIKYLDSLRMVPIRMDRTVVGYYYVTTTMDLAMNPAQPNGIIDLSYQTYTRDKKFVDNLASMIIRSFDKRMLEKNIKLKNEIVEIVMAHKFSEGRLSFIYIPENEIVRIVLNEDENGKGHGIIEPTLFPARMYLMLNLYNMLYILNNNTTRVHYLRSSGINKDYAAQVQRTMRKFQARRITVDDVYSYQGVLNKVGGMGEMVLPAGRGDYKALETDTIEAVNNPINIEFLEQQRRQAISGTGVPHLLIINAIDEVDFAKTLEMANARFLSTVSSYKIDFNRGLTKLYQLLLRYSTDLENDIIKSFRFQFNAIKQQDLNITADMINNFNTVFDVVSSIYYSKDELEDKEGKPTPKQMHLRRELAKEYLPQLDLDKLEDIVKKVNVDSTDDVLQQRVSNIDITDEEISTVTSSK